MANPAKRDVTDIEMPAKVRTVRAADGPDEDMREYIQDMLVGLSAMAAQAKLHDLSTLLRIAVREAGTDGRIVADAAAVRAALNE